MSNFEARYREFSERFDEDQRGRKLALELIDIGYRRLAAKLRSAIGPSSPAAMARLERVRVVLKRRRRR